MTASPEAMKAGSLTRLLEQDPEKFDELARDTFAWMRTFEDDEDEEDENDD